MEFDIVTGLITAAIALLSAVSIYLIADFSRKGSSYDDIKASQRRERNSQTNNIENNIVESKKLKKIKKKSKVKSASTATPEEVEDTSNELPSSCEENVYHVEQTEEVYQIKVNSVEAKPKSKPKASKKVKDSKLAPAVNIIVEKPIEPPVEPEIQEEIIPSTVEPATVENDEVNNAPLDANSSAAVKLKKKAKKKKPDDITDGSKIKSGAAMTILLPMLQQADLSHSELQILIDALLNKDNDSEWNKGKQDPMLKLKKQLSEMEKLQADYNDTINGLQAKLSSLRTELNTEKVNNKNMREALNKAGTDFMSMQLKCQQCTDENQSLILRIQQLTQQLNDEQMLIVKLEEEKVLHQQMHVPHDQHHEAVLALQGQVNQLAAQLQEQTAINATLGVQLQESIRIQEDCRSLNAELSHLLSTYQFDVNQHNTEIANISKEVEDARSQIEDLRNMVETLETLKNELSRENENLKLEVSKHNQEARAFQKMTESEQNIDSSKKNGNLNFAQGDHTVCQTSLEEKETMVKSLNKELAQKESMVEKLTNDIIACKNEANKKQTLIESLNLEIMSLKTQNSKLSSDLNEERVSISKLHSCISEKNETLSKLNKDIDCMKHRNNELQSKNWKVVEALEKAEASLKDVSSRFSNSVKDDSSDSEKKLFSVKSRINNLVKHLDPSLDCVEDTEIWLNKLEGFIDKLNHDHNSQKLMDEISRLQNLVTNYRSIINDLEIMLHNLELRIETEDKKLQSIRPESRLSPEVDG